MKKRALLGSCVMLFLAACDTAFQPAFDEMLVARFDVPECSEIQPLRMAGSREGNLRKVVREYSADETCLSALARSVRTFDFKEERPGTFVARRDKGWTERLVLGKQERGSETNVYWEEMNP